MMGVLVEVTILFDNAIFSVTSSHRSLPHTENEILKDETILKYKPIGKRKFKDNLICELAVHFRVTLLCLCCTHAIDKFALSVECAALLDDRSFAPRIDRLSALRCS